MLKTKLLVAFITAPPFIWFWYQGAPYFNWLMALFSILAADEVAAMGTKGQPAGAEKTAAWPTRASAALASLAIYLPAGFGAAIPWTTGEALLVGLLVIFIAHVFFPGDMASVGNRTGIAMLAAVYGGVPVSYLIMVRMIPEHGRGLAFLALSLSWFCDTFAYFGGKAFGKTKLYPKMSPNKTVEGLLSGAVAAGIAAYIVSRVAEIPWSATMAVAVGLVSAPWGQLGDLCESMLKRSFGVKDAGFILPGHGGVLDRFDAVLFVAPYIYFVHRFFG
ncbi:MAG: phosphatidate cytidylyltransferase [Deltaproteobacteria bacterium]|nr:phosphatidate cytidylyltransferase [Deltaproteobacteria bacterium]